VPKRFSLYALSKEAMYTSKHFISEDTFYIRSSDYLPNLKTKTAHFGEWKKLGHSFSERYVYNQDNIKIGLQISSWLCDNIVEGVVNDKYVSSICPISLSLDNDYSVLEDSGNVLIGRAISNAKNYIDYFFRARIEANINGDTLTIKNISDPNTVGDISYITFKENSHFTILYDDKNTNTRKALPITNFLETSLQPNDEVEFTLDIDDDTYNSIKDHKLIILFDGKAGDEQTYAVTSVIYTKDTTTPPDNNNQTDNNNADNNDNNQTDPTQDPNKVCVSNYFKYYGDGKIHDNLKKGDKDAELYSDGTKHQVKELQEFLEAFGYNVGSSGADGWFGSDTKNALIEFQKANGLDADGIVGPNTREVMNSTNCYDK